MLRSPFLPCDHEAKFDNIFIKSKVQCRLRLVLPKGEGCAVLGWKCRVFGWWCHEVVMKYPWSIYEGSMNHLWGLYEAPFFVTRREIAIQINRLILI